MFRIRCKRIYDCRNHNAAISRLTDIIVAIDVSAVLGWFLILGLFFSIQDHEMMVTSPTGQPVTQIMVGNKGVIVIALIENVIS